MYTYLDINNIVKLQYHRFIYSNKMLNITYNNWDYILFPKCQK